MATLRSYALFEKITREKVGGMWRRPNSPPPLLLNNLAPTIGANSRSKLIMITLKRNKGEGK